MRIRGSFRYGWWRVISSGETVRGFGANGSVWVEDLEYEATAFEWLGSRGNE